MSRKLTYNEFVEKSNLIHNNRYDYSKSVYINSNTDLVIICPIHGEFKQKPNSHLQNHGCHECGGSKKLTTENFIQRSSKVHDNKYRYEKSIYKNNNSKLIVTCPLHGDFNQLSHDHLKGHGCEKCRRDLIKSIHQEKRKGTSEFICEAKLIHGNKYEYDKCEYIRSGIPTTIICPEHGEFQQIPYVHLSGHGCSACVGVKPHTLASFIEKANQIHNEKYNYSKSIYVNYTTKLTINCPIHGEFEQTPAEHLSHKRGCVKCHWSLGESLIHQYLEINKIPSKTQYRLDYGGRLDFYLPIHQYAIEYHGQQHYTPQSFGSTKITGMDNLKDVIKRDEKKVDWCQRNQIQLIVIPFWEINRIDQLLDAYLNNQDITPLKPPLRIKQYQKYRITLNKMGF